MTNFNVVQFQATVAPRIAKPAQFQVGQLVESSSIGLNAIYRNLNNTQVAVRERTPLKIDGLNTAGGFNTFGYEVWDPATSRILPKNISQAFDIRVIFRVTPTVSNSLLTLDVDIGSGSPIISEDKPILRLDSSPFMFDLPLYTSEVFLSNGGTLNVTATNPISITNASIWIFLKGGFR